MKSFFLCLMIALSLCIVACQRSPRFRLVKTLNDEASKLVINNNYAYVIGGVIPLLDDASSRAVTVWDISNIESPSFIGKLTGFYGYDIQIVGEHALIVDGSRLQVVDLTDKSAPALVATRTISQGLVMEIAVFEKEAFILSKDGVSIFDITNIESPELSGSLPIKDVWDIEAIAGQVFLLGQELQIYAINGSGQLELISTLPLLVGHKEAVGLDNDLLVSENIVYGTANGLLHIIDISDPKKPFYIASKEIEETSAWPTGLAKQGQFIFVAAWAGGIVAFDVSNPSDPQQIATYDDSFISRLVVNNTQIFAMGPAAPPLILELD